MTPVKVTAQKATKVYTEILVTGFFQDSRPLTGLAAEMDWIHNGILSRLILQGKIRGSLGESTLLATQRKLHAQKILVVGLGTRERFTSPILNDLYSGLYRTLSHLHIKDCTVELFGPTGQARDGARAVDAILSGLRTDPNRRIETTILVPDEERVQRIQQHVIERAGNS